MLDMVELVKEVQRQTNNGPITVHCRYVCMKLADYFYYRFYIAYFAKKNVMGSTYMIVPNMQLRTWFI